MSQRVAVDLANGGSGGRQQPAGGEPTSSRVVFFKFRNEMGLQIELSP